MQALHIKEGVILRPTENVQPWRRSAASKALLTRESESNDICKVLVCELNVTGRNGCIVWLNTGVGKATSAPYRRALNKACSVPVFHIGVQQVKYAGKRLNAFVVGHTSRTAEIKRVRIPVGVLGYFLIIPDIFT